MTVPSYNYDSKNNAELHTQYKVALYSVSHDNRCRTQMWELVESQIHNAVVGVGIPKHRTHARKRGRNGLTN